MTPLTTLPLSGSRLPGAGEQACRVLTLLGVPAPARLVVAAHGALFDGDLSVGALSGLLRDSERGFDVAAHGSAYRLCFALDARRLARTGGLVALSTWPLAARVVTGVSARVDALTAIVRVAEFVAVRAGVSRTAGVLLRHLAAEVPDGPQEFDVLRPRSLADAARAALADPRLTAAARADQPVRADAAARAALLPERHRLFGVPVVPRQSLPGTGS